MKDLTYKRCKFRDTGHGQGCGMWKQHWNTGRIGAELESLTGHAAPATAETRRVR
jgi:hypothetical protein